MTRSATSEQQPTLADDEARLAEYAQALADAVEAVFEQWVIGCVESRLPLLTAPVRAQATAAAREAATTTMPRLRELLATDIAEQRSNPLDVLRSVVRWPTAVLHEAGVAPVERDEFDERAFPDDHYGLVPASFGDIDHSLHEPGLVWGAAKAHVHLRRRRELSDR